jgi:NADPH:quinone reductase-like Zn-dependent oxidoreductase
MKAIVNTKYGSPDVLQFKEVEKPIPGEDQVLVKVYAASVNALDWHILRAKPFLVRLGGGGFLKPKDIIRGADMAGRVEAVGANVTQFRPGDEVFGGCNGGFAEYVCVREKSLVLKPANISFEEAAAVPVAALTALQAIRDTGKLQAGQHVLVNGAGGGVGTYSVQIAKALGAEVTAVCNTHNVDMVRSIGADHVVDYTRENVTRNGQRYDLILDNVGNIPLSYYKRGLNPGGIAVNVGFTKFSHLIQVFTLGAWMSRSGNMKITSMMANINKDDLAVMKELLESGKVVSVIDRCYPFSEVPQAIRYLEEGHAKGKVVITVVQPGK